MPNADGTMTRYEYRRAQQRCVRCGERDAYTMNGHSVCAVCAAKDRESYRKNPKERIARAMEYQKKRRKRLEEAGLCLRCGKRAPRPGLTTCENCFNKARAYDKQHGKPLIPGMCSRCRSNPAIEGQQLCADCYDKTCKSLVKARAVSQAKNGSHVWRKRWEEKK